MRRHLLAVALLLFVGHALMASNTVLFGSASGGDANGDGAVGPADVFYLINFLFAAGPPPVRRRASRRHRAT